MMGKSSTVRRICLAAACLMLLLPAGAMGEGNLMTVTVETQAPGESDLPAPGAALTAVAPAEGALPLQGPAPYPPVEGALGADGLTYEDGTLSVRIEPDRANDTNIYWVSVKITNASQLRTALAGPKGTKKLAKPEAIARHANAVLALNGDFFTSHDSGVVYRQGELIRDVPVYSRDELLIDENGDLHILAFPPKTGKQVIAEAIADFRTRHQIREAFCFGPGLIIDGVRQQFDYTEKVSCGYPTRAQRIIFCQTGPLEYLFLVTEGKEQDQPGFTVPECVDLLEARGGILQAYNLDGGNSSQIILCGEKVNARDFGKARDIADMIVFATLAKPEE